MFALQLKNRGVIKSTQAIGAIVTRQTRFAHCRAMLGDKPGVVARVTIDTHRQHSGGIDLTGGRCESVTRLTRQRGVVVIALMQCERESKLTVWHIHQRRASQTRRASFMIGVTRGTFLRVRQLSVNPFCQSRLSANLGMTIHTPRAVRSAKRRMAKFTAHLKVGVGSKLCDDEILWMLRAE